MDRSEYAHTLAGAIVDALREFSQQFPKESPYALAIVLGQCGNYLGYAIATEKRLRQVAARYAARGYRYQAFEWEEVDNLSILANWLRWSNPDDGWHFGDFPDRFRIAGSLARLVKAGEFGSGAEDLEEFCTEVLAGLQSEPNWRRDASDRVIVGVTSGSDPRDFLRTATRANRYGVVRKLWAEHWRGEELAHRIPAPG